MEFISFPAIPRLVRSAVYTEKIDGSNGVIGITEDSKGFFVGSRERWLTEDDDNYGFCAWANKNREELVHVLGPGRHTGEWWGKDIGRGYGIGERRFSLFNTGRWTEIKEELEKPPEWAGPHFAVAPTCCRVVPVLVYAPFSTQTVNVALDVLRIQGSMAEPFYKNPEGVVVYHTAAKQYFKRTFNGDKK